MDELAALRYQRLLREGKLASSQDGKVPVYLQLQDETGFHHEGTIDLSDNSVDSSTSTLLIRASFISMVLRCFVWVTELSDGWDS